MATDSDSYDQPTVDPYASAQLANVAAAVRELAHPTQIGPYLIREPLGEGGMGTVYKAEQREPVQRTVAVKIIKLGLDTRQVIARFESERQALAMMNHPNVARMLDAGATETGRPYFVMEYVQGEPITRFADRHKLPMRDRLELFMQACDAVQHAHQKAIIHRDLKPSNILVTMQDGKPLVKVIDFGVAKATNQRLTEKTLFTETGQMVGTPEYMAPEQAEATGMLDVDTRSDVYSLGVILYELLSGALPFDATSLRSAGYREIQRIIREVDPPRPSTRLSGLGDNGGREVARLRQLELASLETQLKNELEWIPLKAMRKEPTERYGSPSELADDIANYIANRPLRAGPETVGYRARKFLRRNKHSVGIAATIALILVGGIIATSWQAVRATRAERQTRAALDEIARQKREVENRSAGLRAVNDFLTRDMLGSADPSVAPGQMVSVKQALDTAAASVDTKFRDQPLIAASIRSTLGNTYDALGRPDLGLPHAQWALAQRRKLQGDDHPETIDAMGVVVTLLETIGDTKQCEPLALEAAERARRVLGSSDILTIRAVSNVGHLYHAQGRFAQAEAMYREAMDDSRRAFGPDHPETLTAISNVASVLQSQGKNEQAEPLFREIVATADKALPKDHPDRIKAGSNLAMTLQGEHKFDEAERIDREMLAIARRVLPKDHPDLLIMLRNLAGVLQDTNKLNEAEPLLREALEASQRTLPPGHPIVVGSLNNLASLLGRMGKNDESEQLFSRALAQCRTALGAMHPYTLIAINNYGQALVRAGKSSQAEPLYAELYRNVAQSELPAEQVAVLMSRWGTTLAELKRYDQAEAPLLAALARLRSAKPRDPGPLEDVLDSLAAIAESKGLTEQAASYRAEAAALKSATTLPSASRPTAR